MILHYLRNHLSRYSEKGNRVLSKYEQYLNAMYTKKTLIEAQFLKAETAMSLGVQMLKQVLDSIDIDYLNELNNDQDRYYSYWHQVQDSLLFPLHSNTAVPFKETFIAKNLYSTAEFITPIKHVDYLTAIPFDQPYIAWKNSISPVRLLSHDSEDFTLDLRGSKIKFYEEQPIVALFGIDPIALGMKYFAYKKDFPEYNSANFIHDEVMVDLFDDLIDIWIGRKLLTLLTIENQIESIDPISNDLYSTDARSSQLLLPTINEFLNFINQVRDGRDPGYLINSIKLFNGTLLDRVTVDLDNVNIELEQQSYWLIYLRDMMWLELLVRIHLLNPRNTQSKDFFKVLNYRIKKLNRSGFLKMIKNNSGKSVLTEHFNMIQSLII